MSLAQPTNRQVLEAQKANLVQIGFLLSQAVANPTPSNVVAAVQGLTAAGLLQARPDYSLDGESYQWGAYQRDLAERIAKLNALIQAESVAERPWVVKSVYRP